MQKSFRLRTSVTFLIIISMLLPSVGPVLAQEEVNEPIARQDLVIDSAPSDTEDTAVDESNTETDVPKESEDTTTSDPASTLAPVQPKIDTKIRPEVDETTGALRYSYPIEIPQGRSGMTPNLSLNYNSENKDNQSAFGYGWDLSIPHISRINKHGTNELHDRYDFVSSIDGELEKVNDTTYRAKIENGSFNQYTFIDNVWTLKTKDGQTYIFGDNTSSRQDDTTQEKIYKWMLSRELDANENIIKYSYFKDQGQIYPEKIAYTLSSTIGGKFEVEFVREGRTDTIESYSTAFSVKTNYRVNEIQAKINGTQSRKYILDYTVGDNGVRSVLSGITKSAVSESGIITTLPRMGFEYSKSGSTIYGDTTRLNTDELYASSDMNGLVAGDINGDAYPDMLKAYEYNCYNYFLSKKTFLFNPTLNLFQESPTYLVPESIINLTRFCYSKLYGGTRILDVNSDGMGDLMRTPNSNSNPAREINNGDSWIQ
ncbi:MAG: SpvB/TcaC N-terminal domain-containing protein, partial [Patescibacteria group bacterium]